MNVLDFDFTFETEQDYTNARIASTRIEYKMARIHVVYPNGYDVDYPVHNRQDLINELVRLNKVGATIKEVYQSEHYRDMIDYE